MVEKMGASPGADPPLAEKSLPWPVNGTRHDVAFLKADLTTPALQYL